MNTDTIALLDKHFGLAINAPDGLKRLREMILTLAMQGKLVPQDPKDQPASELLKKIEAEKKRLVKEGKIKEPKPLPPIKPEEVPYELPESWEWVRLGTISEYIQRGKGPRYSDDKVYPVISQKCIQWSGFDHTVVKFIDPNSICDYSEERFILKNDLLWNSTGTGTIGRIGIYQDELSNYTKVVVDSHVTVIRLLKINPLYTFQFLKSPLIQNAIEAMASGTTNQIELNTSTVIEQVIPLPPLVEQVRIVAKIDELMARVDELERKRDARNEKRFAMHQAAIARLLDAGDANASRSGRDFIFAHFGELYGTRENVAELRKAILQLAVMGRLVPQDPQDQPASELLKEIEAEKKRLVQDGKIKEPKPFPPIKSEEVPYQVPKGWEWVRLGELVSKLGSGSTPKGGKEAYSDEGIMFFRSQNIYDDGLRTDNISCITPAIHEKMAGTKILPFDILFNITGGSLGRSALVPEDFSEGNISQHVCIIRPVNLNNDYIHKLTISAVFQNQIPGGITGSGREGLQKNRMELFVIPLPPLAEQHRIVAKVDELMALCGKLDKQIDQRTAKESALLEAVAARV